MSTRFSYAARESGGIKVRGEIVALNVEQALSALQQNGVYVTRIEPAPAGRRKGSRVVLPAGERSLLIQSWACLLDSGFSMDTVLSRLQSSAQHPSVRKALQEAQGLIRDGATLAEAVELSGLLPPSWAAVLEAGEKRGDLIRPMMALRDRSDQIRKAVQGMVSVLLMPMVLVALVFVWIWIFSGWLLPVMAQTAVETAGTSNPLWVGLKGWTAMTLPAAIAAAGVLGFLILVLFRAGRSGGSAGGVPAWIPPCFPFIGSLVSKVYLVVIASELQLQLEAGIPLLTALQSLSRSVSKRTLQKELAQACRQISGGVPEWRVIANLGIIPEQAFPLLAAGQACGKLPQLLGVLVRETSLDLETEAYRVAIKMRTCAVVMAGIIVGILAVSVMALFSCVIENIEMARAVALPPNITP